MMHLKKIETILKNDAGRFSDYQEIPSFILSKYPALRDIAYKQKQLQLDSERYNWLKSNINNSLKTVIEIGSNMGFFCFSMINDFFSHVTAYEPIKTYYNFCNELITLMAYDDIFHINNYGINNNNIDALNTVDLIVHLNVLHHAGAEYDHHLVSDPISWRSYAVRHLATLAAKAKFLFFQQGNMMNGQRLYCGENVVKFNVKLLDEAGWKILSVGMIDDLNTLKYEKYSLEKALNHSAYHCIRNKDTGLVDYYKDSILKMSLKTGLAQRPLFYCIRK